MNKNQTNKFINKTFFEPYPSDPIPPRLFDTMNVHKPEKKHSHASQSFYNMYAVSRNTKSLSQYSTTTT